jgi:hypothetical protein
MRLVNLQQPLFHAKVVLRVALGEGYGVCSYA